jgi:hypothetical protein
MDTWMKVGIISPYILIIIGVIGYFLRKKDDTLVTDHELLLKIKTKVEEIERRLVSDKGKWTFYMSEVDVHERWMMSFAHALRQIKAFLLNHLKETVDIDEDLKRPPEIKQH